jgi:hypothetical protein
MVKLIRVKCRRPTDAEDAEPYAGVAFAANKAHAEQMCRDAFADRGYTSFEAEEPVEGPFEDVQPQVLVFEGRRLSTTSIDELRRSATRAGY